MSLPRSTPSTWKCPRCGGTNGPGPQKDPVGLTVLEENRICSRCFAAWVSANIPPMQPIQDDAAPVEETTA